MKSTVKFYEEKNVTFINEAEKVTALVVTPELGCQNTEISASVISKIVGGDFQAVKIDNSVLFVKSGNMSIPFNKTDKNPTIMLFLREKIVMVYGTAVICTFDEYSEKEDKVECKLRTPKSDEIASLRYKNTYSLEKSLLDRDFQRLFFNGKSVFSLTQSLSDISVTYYLKGSYIKSKDGVISYSPYKSRPFIVNNKNSSIQRIL